MNLNGRFTPAQPAVDPTKPVFTVTFWEDGEWMRVVRQDGQTRFIKKKDAIVILQEMGRVSRSEKSDIYT